MARGADPHLNADLPEAGCFNPLYLHCLLKTWEVAAFAGLTLHWYAVLVFEDGMGWGGAPSVVGTVSVGRPLPGLSSFSPVL